MNETAFSELIEQALIIRMALEALAPIVLVLGCVALAAFVLYLLGVFHLCRAEVRPSQKSQGSAYGFFDGAEDFSLVRSKAR